MFRSGWLGSNGSEPLEVITSLIRESPYQETNSDTIRDELTIALCHLKVSRVKRTPPNFRAANRI
jgi:hypothetical protein